MTACSCFALHFSGDDGFGAVFFFPPCAHLAISVSFWELPASMYLCLIVSL